nr:3D domain-containing protein [Maliibacterium massiliense]
MALAEANRTSRIHSAPRHRAANGFVRAGANVLDACGRVCRPWLRALAGLLKGRKSEASLLSIPFLCALALAAAGAAAMVVVPMVTRHVVIVEDGAAMHVTVANQSVEALMARYGIELGAHDALSAPPHADLHNGMILSVEHAKPLLLRDGNTTTLLYSTSDTVQDVLAEENVVLSELDQISPALSSNITANMSIDITRVTHAQEVLQEQIPFTETVSQSASLARGVKKVQTAGQNGEKSVTQRVVYKNGVEVARYPIAETIVKEPVNQVVLEGTRVQSAASNRPNALAASAKTDSAAANAASAGMINGVSYARVISGSATAYTHTGNNTATGAKPGVGTIAVDPRVIPLGTRLYIPGYGFGVAADTGGSIKGNKVDVFFNSRQECINWGRRNVQIYILN